MKVSVVKQNRTLQAVIACTEAGLFLPLESTTTFQPSCVFIQSGKAIVVHKTLQEILDETSSMASPRIAVYDGDKLTLEF